MGAARPGQRLPHRHAHLSLDGIQVHVLAPAHPRHQRANNVRDGAHASLPAAMARMQCGQGPGEDCCWDRRPSQAMQPWLRRCSWRLPVRNAWH